MLDSSGCCLLIANLASIAGTDCAVHQIHLQRVCSVYTKQTRVEKGQKPFCIYKIRTMNGGKVTKIGAILRATGIDELFQLWNILKGEMAFVGPRPLTIEDVIRLNWSTPYYVIRWSVKPGITGLAQLSTQCHRKITWVYDQHYALNHTLWIDTKCVVYSLFVPLIGKKGLLSIQHHPVKR